jgi:hypothetical protein
MNKEQVLAINGLTQAQKEAAERWFATPFNKNKEMEGTAAQVKQFLNQKIAAYQKNQERKTKKEEDFGTLDKVIELVKSLCHSTRQQKALFTYNEICEYIEAATDEKVRQANEINEQFAQLKAQAETLGIKLK